MNIYEYTGIVELFGKIIETNWHGETTASSVRKARSNLTYQYKTQNGYATNSSIILPGTVRRVQND